MKVYVLYTSGAKCVYKETELNILINDLKEIEPENCVKLKIWNISKKQYNKLPEFVGW